MEFSKMKKIQFLDHTPLKIKAIRKSVEKIFKKKISYDEIILHLRKKNEKKEALTCFLEKKLIEAEMPFFNVYPKVVEALIRTSLSIVPETIPRSIIHSLGSICIKLPLDKNNRGFDFFILSVFNSETMKEMESLGCSRILHVENIPSMVVFGQGDNEGFTLAVPLDMRVSDVQSQISDEAIVDIAKPFIRIALGVMMLAADPDYIKPVLLKADEDKTTPIEERIARARNRGVYGFTIGEEIERSPHFRRPHFAIRWTGKGGEIPKLVAVKGSIVGKKELVTVPTGYENDVRK